MGQYLALHIFHCMRLTATCAVKINSQTSTSVGHAHTPHVELYTKMGSENVDPNAVGWRNHENL